MGIKTYQCWQKLECASSSEFLKNSSEWVLSEFSSPELQNLDQVRDLTVSSGQDTVWMSLEGALGGWTRDKNIKSQHRLANNQREYPLSGRFESKTKGSNSKIANCRMFDEASFFILLGLLVSGVRFDQILRISFQIVQKCLVSTLTHTLSGDWFQNSLPDCKGPPFHWVDQFQARTKGGTLTVSEWVFKFWNSRKCWKFLTFCKGTYCLWFWSQIEKQSKGTTPLDCSQNLIKSSAWKPRNIWKCWIFLKTHSLTVRVPPLVLVWNWSTRSKGGPLQWVSEFWVSFQKIFWLWRFQTRKTIVFANPETYTKNTFKVIVFSSRFNFGNSRCSFWTTSM